MDTGDYTYIQKDGISSVIAMLFEFISLGSAFVLGSAAEPQDDIIAVMMKRLGVQKSTLVMRDLCMQGIFSAICTFIAVITLWAVAYRTYLGLGVFFLFAIMN